MMIMRQVNNESFNLGVISGSILFWHFYFLSQEWLDKLKHVKKQYSLWQTLKIFSSN
jgi:hypothetical protein